MRSPAVPRSLELLAPARDADVAREAILHGADAVYIGPAAFGARAAAGNSLDDIHRLTDFAHPYRVKIYATVNTVVRDSELADVEKLIRGLYQAGVDALIVQDMGILRLDIPPIELHASTQCHIASPAKARFLQDAGFSQLVLARELSLNEIREITQAVTVPVEAFVHGALCVSYSGRCHASQQAFGRSANRGECAQICRLPYNLTDATGHVIARDRHLLSLRDFNQIDSLAALAAAGVSSFKIEGRLKETGYVKNVTAAYRQALDSLIASYPELYRRASCGESLIDFTPDLLKSFNRGFTHYFFNPSPGRMASTLTPKSLGEPVKSVSTLNNGDGISFFDRKGRYTGVNVNRVENGRIIPARKVEIPRGTTIHRTYDRLWETRMAKPTAKRRIPVDISLDMTGVTATDQRGVSVRLPLGFIPQPAKKQASADTLRAPFDKLGDTIYTLGNFNAEDVKGKFIPASVLTALRRNLVTLLDSAARIRYPRQYRRPEDPVAVYPVQTLSYKDNVANRLAAAFYKSHGVREIVPALEADGRKLPAGEVLMTTRYCILRELGMCKRRGKMPFREPLRLTGSGVDFTLRFDCKRCGMELLSR